MLFYFIILLLYYFFIIFTSCSLENITGLPQAGLKSVKATFCVTYVINNLQKHCRQYRPCINKSTLFLLFHFFCQSLFLLNKQLCFSLSVHRTVYQAHKYVVEQIFFSQNASCNEGFSVASSCVFQCPTCSAPQTAHGQVNDQDPAGLKRFSHSPKNFHFSVGKSGFGS